MGSVCVLTDGDFGGFRVIWQVLYCTVNTLHIRYTFGGFLVNMHTRSTNTVYGDRPLGLAGIRVVIRY